MACTKPIWVAEKPFQVGQIRLAKSAGPGRVGSKEGQGRKNMRFGKAALVAAAIVTLGPVPLVAKTFEPSLAADLDAVLLEKISSGRVAAAPDENPKAASAVPVSSVAQLIGSNEVAVRQLEAKGYREIKGLVR